MKAMELQKSIIQDMNGLPITFLEELNDFMKFVKKTKINDKYFTLYLRSKRQKDNFPKEIIVSSVEEVRNRVKKAENQIKNAEYGHPSYSAKSS